MGLILLSVMVRMLVNDICSVDEYDADSFSLGIGM